MGGEQTARKADVRTCHTVYLKEQPTTLRRCLGCDDWMHSTSVCHRMCNACKGLPNYEGSPVGRRITIPGKRKGESIRQRAEKKREQPRRRRS